MSECHYETLRLPPRGNCFRRRLLVFKRSNQHSAALSLDSPGQLNSGQSWKITFYRCLVLADWYCVGRLWHRCLCFGKPNFWCSHVLILVCVFIPVAADVVLLRRKYSLVPECFYLLGWFGGPNFECLLRQMPSKVMYFTPVTGSGWHCCHLTFLSAGLTS